LIYLIIATRSLDIFCLRHKSLEESDNLPDPDVLGPEIVEDLEAALEQFRESSRI
jgi:type I restriction enzyme M protein